MQANGNIITLGHIARAKATNDRRYGEYHAQPFEVEALLHDKHGATNNVALIVHVPIFMAERDFDELGCHAKERGHPHPKQRRWAT